MPIEVENLGKPYPDPDRPGVFPYYCNLQIDDGCRRMRGELIVKPRR